MIRLTDYNLRLDNGYSLVLVYFPSPFPKRQILDSSKLKEFANDNFKFDEKDRKFSRQVEKLWEKEIARDE